MNNTYGTIKPSNVDMEKDVELYYRYSPTRNSYQKEYQTFKEIKDVTTVLTSSISDNGVIIDGMYNLKLPVSIFGRKGFYTIYIKPKEYKFTIQTVGSLVAYPEVNGIVINDNHDLFNKEDGLTGYRVDYYGDNISLTGQPIKSGLYRIITGNNKCEPVSQNLLSSNSNSVGFRFNRGGSLNFITVSPFTSPNFKGSSKPYIGEPNQLIGITNTKFDPVMINIDMVEHDAETISYTLEGEQIRNLETGRLTTYNFDGEIYKQHEFATIKNNYNERNVLETKFDRTNELDTSISLDELKDL